MWYFDVDTWRINHAGKEICQISDELSGLAARVGLIRAELEKMSGMREICHMLGQKRMEVRHLAEIMDECGYVCVQIAGRYLDTEEELIFLARNTTLYESENAPL